MTTNLDLEFALELADIADQITLARFRAADLVVETKPDMTPVTEADRAVEEALAARIAAVRPNHGVVGEEFGSRGSTRSRWIIDPIDGTKNYVRGIPVFATLIALETDGVIQLGLVSAPALERRWWAARGEGAFANGESIRVSGVDQLGDAQLLHAGLDEWELAMPMDALLGLAARTWRSRGFGDFWQHMLVAEGSAEIAIDPQVSLWDVAALLVIVEEAGGRLTDLEGAARADGGSAVTTNGWLHDIVLNSLRTAKD
jgi:histidinol-phosphatase